MQFAEIIEDLATANQVSDEADIEITEVVAGANTARCVLGVRG